MTFTEIILSFVAVLLSAIGCLLHMILCEIESLNRHVSDEKAEFQARIRMKLRKNRANRLTDTSKQWLQARSAADKEVR